MQKEPNFKRNMNSQQRGQSSTSNIDLGQYRSRHELLKVFQIKREKVLKNIARTTKPPTTKENSSQAKEVGKQNKGYIEGNIKLPKTKHVNSQAKEVAQFKLSDFAGSDQRILDSTRELVPTKKISDSASNTLHKIPTQRRTTTETSMARDKGSKLIQDQKSKILAQVEVPKQMQDSKRQAMRKKVVEDDGSRDRQQLLKTTMAGNDISKQKHQPKKRAISENHTSKDKEQCKKRVVEDDGSRDIQLIKTSVGSDHSKQKHQQKKG